MASLPPYLESFLEEMQVFVDHPSRLKVIRVNTLLAKLAVTSLYAFLLILLDKYPSEAKLAGQRIQGSGHAGVTTIADGSDARLTRLDLWMRRIDLGCKLVAPLFAGLLTSTVGDLRTLIVIGCIAIGGLGFELLWISIVWKRFPVLATNHREVENNSVAHLASHGSGRLSLQSLKAWLKTTYDDWNMFIHNPVFISSLAISLLYFTTLSLDGNMISWLKTNSYSDGLIPGLRGISVCAGLAGIVLMPKLEKRIGLTRAGSWSIWSEVLFLAPVLVSFYVPSHHQGSKAPVWNQALLSGGMSASRIGLFSFDLCQLKLLQKTLAEHPRRNTRNGLQYSLQNVLDLLKYVMIIVLSRPSQFKYTATLSFAAVVTGACLYMKYLHRERGHLIHTEWFALKKFT